MSGGLPAARRRLEADRQVVKERLNQMITSKRSVEVAYKESEPALVVGGGVMSGLLVGLLPAKVLGALIGGVAVWSLRLMSSPLGPMAFGAIMASRKSRHGGNVQPTVVASQAPVEPGTR